MPELPDVELYREALAERIVGRTLERVELRNAFVLRTAVPPIGDLEGRGVRGVRRLGKRIVLAFDDAYYVVVHLMIAGRLRWLVGATKVPARIALAVLHFDNGRLAFTEAGTKRRASLHVVQGDEMLRTFDMGGLEVLAADYPSFEGRLLAENHTLKRALTDPRLFSGIGNAYSDEILHRARLSPLALTSKLDEPSRRALYDATRSVLADWSRWLRDEAKGGFPEQVTAFRPGMAVHGRYGQPCPVCGSPVQRIVYAENECNYCATCQTNGKLLADRSLSRLLHASWPKSIDELG
jgi:formamidopyrimidine-DNA glycosylase